MAGNGAVVGLVQRERGGTRARADIKKDALGGDTDAIQALGTYDDCTVDERIGFLGAIMKNIWVGPNDETAIERIWGSFGDQLFSIAASHTSLWEQCTQRDDDLVKTAAVKAATKSATDKFIADVRSEATRILNENSKTVDTEVASLGGDKNKGDEADKADSPEQRQHLLDIQNAAARVARAREVKKGCASFPVGSRIVGEGGVDETEPVMFPEVHDQGGPPASDPSLTTYDRAAYKRAEDMWTGSQAIITHLTTTYPALFAVDNVGGEQATAKVAQGSPAEARKDVLATLHAMRDHIASAQDDIRGDVAYELLPIQDALFKGNAKAMSGIDWTSPVYNAVGQSVLKDHADSQFWLKLGLGTLAAAGFVVATFASGGIAAFALGFATTLGIGQTALAWEKAHQLADMDEAAMSPQAKLVERGQVEEAGIDALLSTYFSMLDIGMAAGILSKLAGAAELAKAIAAGGEEAAQKLAAFITKYGAAAAVKATGSDAEKLLSILGKDHPLAGELTLLAGSVKAATLGADALADAIKTKGVLTVCREQNKTIEDLLDAVTDPEALKMLQDVKALLQKTPWQQLTKEQWMGSREIQQQVFEFAKAARTRMRSLGEDIVNRIGGWVSKEVDKDGKVVLRQLHDARVTAILKRDDFDGFVQGVYAKCDRNGYSSIGQMDDMIRGRIDLNDAKDVFPASYNMAFNGTAEVLTIVDQDGKQVAKSSMPRVMKIAKNPADNVIQRYPRYHIIVRDGESGMTFEWQIGSEATTQLYEAKGIVIPDALTAAAEAAGKHFNNDLHDIEYDVFQGLLKSKDPEVVEYAKSIGADSFVKKVGLASDKAANFGNEWDWQATIAALSAEASRMLKEIVEKKGPDYLVVLLHG